MQSNFRNSLWRPLLLVFAVTASVDWILNYAHPLGHSKAIDTFYAAVAGGLGGCVMGLLKQNLKGRNHGR